MVTVTPETSNGMRDLNAAALWRSGVHPAQTRLGGRGVVTCVIDYGFDLFHPTLRNPNGTTRFAQLIDQNRDHNSRALPADEINLLIASGDRRRADRLYDPHANYFGAGGAAVGAHGTWVASIAAGTQSALFTGVAPETTLIGVQLALPDATWRETSIADIASCQQRWRSYDEAQAIIDALDQGFAAAAALAPDGIVFNLSIGAWAGSHHPKAAVNRALSRLAARNGQAGRALFVVAGSGNAGGEAGHFEARVASGESTRFAWHMGSGARVADPAGRMTPHKLEIWSDGAVRVRLTHSTQPSFDIVLDGPGRQAVEMAGEVICVGELQDKRCDALHCARFLISPLAADPGQDVATVRIEITAASANAGPAELHAWIERDCDGCASHLSPAHRSTTLTSLATAPGVIAVGGLDDSHGSAAPRALAMSGRGPAPWQGAGAEAREDRAAPSLAAPGAGIFGARSKTTGFMRGSGTSAAAAITSGAVALGIEWARAHGSELRGPELTRERLLDLLCGPQLGAWQADTGRGALLFAPSQRSAQARAPSAGAHIRAIDRQAEETPRP